MSDGSDPGSPTSMNQTKDVLSSAATSLPSLLISHGRPIVPSIRYDTITLFIHAISISLFKHSHCRDEQILIADNLVFYHAFLINRDRLLLWSLITEFMLFFCPEKNHWNYYHSSQTSRIKLLSARPLLQFPAPSWCKRHSTCHNRTPAQNLLFSLFSSFFVFLFPTYCFTSTVSSTTSKSPFSPHHISTIKLWLI